MHRIPDPKVISIEDMAKIFGDLIKKEKLKDGVYLKQLLKKLNDVMQ